MMQRQALADTNPGQTDLLLYGPGTSREKQQVANLLGKKSADSHDLNEDFLQKLRMLPQSQRSQFLMEHPMAVISVSNSTDPNQGNELHDLASGRGTQ